MNKNKNISYWPMTLINQYRLHIPLGILLMIVSIATWILDWTGLVAACPYCQTQRTLLGIVGFMLVLDSVVLHYMITIYCMLLGLHVGMAQILLHINKGTFPNLEFSVLAVMASYAFLISGLVMVSRVIYTHNESRHKEKYFAKPRIEPAVI